MVNSELRNKPIVKYLWEGGPWTHSAVECLKCGHKFVEARPFGSLHFTVCPKCGDNDTADVDD